MTLTRTVRILALSFALAVSACASGTLPNTTIPETEETRAVFDRVQQYRTAMELSLIHISEPTRP